ncbi:MAG: murein transglycosylase [Thermocrispum sp.]
MTEAPRPAALPSRRRAMTRLAVAGLVALAGLALVLTIGVQRPEAQGEEPAPPPAASLPKPGAKVPPRGVSAPVDRPHASDAAELRSWSRRVAGLTDMPERAVRGYGLAEMWMRSEAPGCGLSWTTLAGIGQVASEHGGAIGRDGVLAKPVVGKHGRLGPLLTPLKKWTAHRFRASRDGERPDPQQIDDAAVTVARELCAHSGDLTGPAGWWAAVTGHGGSARFAQDVYTAAGGYARASAAAGR